MQQRIYLEVKDTKSGETYVTSCMLPVQIGKLNTEDNQILLDPVHDRVSRIHGVIEASGRGFTYTDRSSNGSRVGQIVLTRGRTSLSAGFEIEIEHYKIRHVDLHPMVVLHTDNGLAEHGRRDLLAGKGVAIKRDSEGCRLADMNRWTEWREPAIARIELVGKEPVLVLEGATAAKNVRVNKSPIKEARRALHTNDVVMIDKERFEILEPGAHRLVCGNDACHLINPPGFEANCKWCGHHLTNGVTRLLL
jgi:hypothetical protein